MEVVCGQFHQHRRWKVSYENLVSKFYTKSHALEIFPVRYFIAIFAASTKILTLL